MMWLLCIISLAFMRNVSGELTSIPSDVAVLNGTTISLRCSTDTSDDLFWNRLSPGAQSEEHIVEGSEVHPNFQSFYTVMHANQTSTLTTVAEKSIAARYACIEKSTAIRASAEVIVLESMPFCSRDASRYLVNLTCRVTFSGNKYPIIKWTQIIGKEDKNVTVEHENTKAGDPLVTHTSTLSLPVDGSEINQVYRYAVQFCFPDSGAKTTDDKICIFSQRFPIESVPSCSRNVTRYVITLTCNVTFSDDWNHIITWTPIKKEEHVAINTESTKTAGPLVTHTSTLYIPVNGSERNQVYRFTVQFCLPDGAAKTTDDRNCVISQLIPIAGTTSITDKEHRANLSISIAASGTTSRTGNNGTVETSAIPSWTASGTTSRTGNNGTVETSAIPSWTASGTTSRTGNNGTVETSAIPSWTAAGASGTTLRMGDEGIVEITSRPSCIAAEASGTTSRKGDEGIVEITARPSDTGAPGCHSHLSDECISSMDGHIAYDGTRLLRREIYTKQRHLLNTESVSNRMLQSESVPICSRDVVRDVIKLTCSVTFSGVEKPVIKWTQITANEERDVTVGIKNTHTSSLMLPIIESKLIQVYRYTVQFCLPDGAAKTTDDRICVFSQLIPIAEEASGTTPRTGYEKTAESSVKLSVNANEASEADDEELSGNSKKLWCIIIIIPFGICSVVAGIYIFRHLKRSRERQRPTDESSDVEADVH